MEAHVQAQVKTIGKSNTTSKSYCKFQYVMWKTRSRKYMGLEGQNIMYRIEREKKFARGEMYSRRVVQKT